MATEYPAPPAAAAGSALSLRALHLHSILVKSVAHSMVATVTRQGRRRRERERAACSLLLFKVSLSISLSWSRILAMAIKSGKRVRFFTLSSLSRGKFKEWKMHITQIAFSHNFPAIPFEFEATLLTFCQP